MLEEIAEERSFEEEFEAGDCVNIRLGQRTTQVIVAGSTDTPGHHVRIRPTTGPAVGVPSEVPKDLLEHIEYEHAPREPVGRIVLNYLRRTYLGRTGR